MIKGIDVSAHNGVIDWDKVVNSGIGFAIIRIGIGSDMKSQDDKQALANIKACEERGIPWGVYIYSYALTLAEVASEAAHTIRMIKGFNPPLGVWFDMEDADKYKAKSGMNVYKSKALLTEFCVSFMKQLKAAGYKNVGVYANYDYFKNVLDINQIKAVGKIWLAHWGISKPSMPCELWQYASDGTVPGIKGRVDMNYYYGTEIESAPVVKKEYYPKFDTTLIGALNHLGIDSSFAHRKKIAEANKIATNYTGTALQNTKMLDLLKAGKLIKP